ncbi:alpha/beta hydrolase [Phenylobacterium sp.]|jgi:3-oxoadipate enol-lactonase|uniref:alpha/beta fold hydrolase n=1 Tax=Phenylobacterium sp. TaxID=1871053 RepID=UPI0025CB8A39|nr:alpha/beta hydrolase [Phenylobacterium sp.]MCA6285140.1 alpha/beta hydrolase [Phenylobacterium sp.]MCA6289818.1 alpha/beta hydrolase [Phenylobacterium sp.]MCA6309173.1 alpha/beta hydrolase [Phenylobacterium sp.]MCA6322827.1 alpha/beta hydrolase [Phenylobacterium sp.]MCA6336734.1 alpha/beta hydrolase [Phenylobacterium sp.]
MPRVTANGLDIHYERTGQGPRLLFISGTGGDLRVRPNMLDGPFARTFDLVAYDQRGLGQTEKPDRPYAMADYADDAAGLMDALGWEDALVIGVSFGGMVAQNLIVRHPQRVRRLVLACTSPGGAGGASFPFHEIGHLKGEARARRLLPINDTRLDEAWATAHPERFAEAIAQSAADPFAGEPGREMGARRQIEARAGHDVWEALPGVRIPVMIAAGRFDAIAPAQSQLNLALALRGSVLRFFEGGHMFMLQDRTAVPAMIEFLLEGTSGPSA